MTVVRDVAVPWAVAREIAVAAARPPAAALVPLSEAGGCRLAEPLRALVAVPGADVAAMDGYAVAGSGPWRVAGRVLAGGAPFGRALRTGESVEIATGAPVPAGASAVLPYERAVLDSGLDSGLVAGVAEPGRHIRRRGEDVAAGAVVLGAGAVVTPAVLGLAAALGHDALGVRPRPRVSVLVTGDEVVHEGVPAPGRVRDAIGPFLPGLVEWAGGRPAGVVRLPDGAAALRAALQAASDSPGAAALRAALQAASDSPGGAAARRCDVVVVCGASSKGPADHLRAVLADLGAEVLVDGVAVRPGHPQALAGLPGGPLVVGLPGNPFAAFCAAMTLLVPILARQAGKERRRETSALAGRVRTHPHDTRLVPVRRSGTGAIPVGHDRPGSLWGAALADALAVVPPGWAGEQVELIELPAGG
ncbi:molybdopterin molybdotransferase MoeA [Nonomuraea sp. NN258]|uniref:molybdopterin molybdotransferase MoeA n=1 Tax=Nonomuraea antri TaxID=2730852 RepID=UPI001569479D|nr:molybdopterin molybdotransferase MoeA [Nonomuraea antri]NRQ34100.1 molybdopterin molybdotransferase MoeA [Nonomuraea antri]